MKKYVPDLTPRSDNPILQKLHEERAEHEAEVKRLNQELRAARNELFAIRQRLKAELVKAHQEEFDIFYNRLMNLKSIEMIYREEYLKKKHSLLKQLHEREIDISEYRKELKPLSLKANQTCDAVQEFYTEGIVRIFGDDCRFFSIDGLASFVSEGIQQPDNI